MKVDVQEFSANSALDYADLNKLVLAIKTLAAAMPTVTTPVPNTGTPTATVNAAPTILSGSFTVTNAKPVSTTTNGSSHAYTIPFLRNGQPVTFASPPAVTVFASTGGNNGTGLAVVNRAGSSGTTSFDVRVGWVGRKTTGNVAVGYLAIGNEIKA
jgi:hypothetical protein